MKVDHIGNGNRGTQAITHKAIGSVKWASLTEIVSRIAQPIVFVVLARLLTPADFGVLSTALIAISFSQMFWDAGLSKALIQTQDIPEDAANVVFWANIVLGLLVYIILFISSPFLALFFESPASGPVLRVLGIQIIIASLTSVQQALCARDLNFKRLFWIKLYTAFIPGLFSIPLALYGYGVWALVAGAIAGQMLNLCLLWIWSTWRPSFCFNNKLACKLFRFGYWVLLESFGAWLIVWIDCVIAGRFFGVHDLGIYRTGWMLITIIFGLALNSFTPLLFPTYSRLQDNPIALKSIFGKVNRIVIAIALPIGTGLLLVAPEIASLLFGEKWQGLGFVVGGLGFAYSLSCLVSYNPEVYRAAGKPKLNTIIMYVHILYYLPCLYLAAHYGLEAFTLTRLALAISSVPIQVFFCVKILRESPFYLWHQGWPMILSSIGMMFGVVALKWGLFPVIILPNVATTLSILITAGCILYLGILWFLDRSFLLQTYALFRRVVA